MAEPYEPSADPESTTPEGPETAADRLSAANPKSNLPNMGPSEHPVRDALYQTFIAPAVRNVQWQARQFTPSMIGRNILYSNPYGRDLLRFKYNLDYAKNPDTAGFTNNMLRDAENAGRAADAANNNGPTLGAGNSTNVIDVLRVMKDTFNNGFQKMVTELRAIRQTVLAVARVGAANNQETQKVATGIDGLSNTLKDTFGPNKYDKAAASEESGLADVMDQNDPSKPFDPKGKGLLSGIMKLGALLGEGGLAGAVSVAGEAIAGFIAILAPLLGAAAIGGGSLYAVLAQQNQANKDMKNGNWLGGILNGALATNPLTATMGLEGRWLDDKFNKNQDVLKMGPAADTHNALQQKNSDVVQDMTNTIVDWFKNLFDSFPKTIQELWNMMFGGSAAASTMPANAPPPVHPGGPDTPPVKPAQIQMAGPHPNPAVRNAPLRIGSPPPENVAGPHPNPAVRNAPLRIGSPPPENVPENNSTPQNVSFTGGDLTGGFRNHTIIGNTLRIGGSLNWRNNNPGNLMYSDFAKKHGAIGYTFEDNGQKDAVFPNLDVGRKANLALWRNKSNSNLDLTQAAFRWVIGKSNPSDEELLHYAAIANKSKPIFTGSSEQIIKEVRAHIQAYANSLAQVAKVSPHGVTIGQLNDKQLQDVLQKQAMTLEGANTHVIVQPYNGKQGHVGAHGSLGPLGEIDKYGSIVSSSKTNNQLSHLHGHAIGAHTTNIVTVVSPTTVHNHKGGKEGHQTHKPAVHHKRHDYPSHGPRP